MSPSSTSNRAVTDPPRIWDTNFAGLGTHHLQRPAATIWWDEEADDTCAAPHTCTDTCTRVVHGSWVCAVTGVVLGPALLVPSAQPRPREKPVKNRGDVSIAARGRFVTAVQDLLHRLIKGEKRLEVEGARAEKARAMAMRAASRSIALDTAAGHMPNMGIALCAAWTSYEAGTNALVAVIDMDADTESRILEDCGDFFVTHLARQPHSEVHECRPKLEALALALLYFKRDGIPGIINRSNFLSANLPDLGRLRNYNCAVSSFTHGKRYIQSVLDAKRTDARGEIV